MKSTEDLRLGKQYLKIRSYDKALEHLTKAVIQGDRAAVSLLYKPVSYTHLTLPTT